MKKEITDCIRLKSEVEDLRQSKSMKIITAITESGVVSASFWCNYKLLGITTCFIFYDQEKYKLARMLENNKTI